MVHNFACFQPILKFFDVLKSVVFALSLRNNVSTLFCVCALRNLTSLKSLLNLLNKCGFILHQYARISQPNRNPRASTHFYLFTGLLNSLKTAVSLQKVLLRISALRGPYPGPLTVDATEFNQIQT